MKKVFKCLSLEVMNENTLVSRGTHSTKQMYFINSRNYNNFFIEFIITFLNFIYFKLIKNIFDIKNEITVFVTNLIPNYIILPNIVRRYLVPFS